MSHSEAFGGRFERYKLDGERFSGVLKGSRSHSSQPVIIDWYRKGEKNKKQSFKLQERGTALKNKGDRCQYINFMRMKKKNQLIKIDYCCFVNVFLN